VSDELTTKRRLDSTPDLKHISVIDRQLRILLLKNPKKNGKLKQVSNLKIRVDIDDHREVRD
jgi:hypothetical protein